MKKLDLKLLALGAVLLASCAGGDPASIESSTERLTANTVAGRYIVVFKDGTTKVGVAGRGVADVAASMQRDHGGTVVRTFQHALHGFVARMTPSEAEEMERAIATNCERIDASQW